MPDVLPELALVALLVLLNALFAGTELALVSLRESQLQRLERQSRSGAVLARLARDPNRFLATIQIGITLAGLLASAAAAVSLAEPLVESLGFLGGAAEPTAVFLVTLALAYVTLVFGELAPKRAAMQRAERWGLVAARPLAAMALVTRPAVWLLSRSTDVVVRLLGGDPTQQREDISGEELREIVTRHTHLTPKQRDMIDGAFEISERTLVDVLRPRPDVFVVDAERSAAEALHDLAAHGHSRAPVGQAGHLDEIIGVVHWRDLLTHSGRSVADLATPFLALPETVPVLDALHELQTRRAQMAVVIDEHGTAAGIVTVEDLVEEVVGEIYDESDRDVISVERHVDETLTIPGRFPVHDLPDVGIDDIPDGPYAAVAGLVLDRLGRIPERPGDRVTVSEWTFEVTAVRRRAIMQVRASRR
jgi:putative hemolysin